MPRGVVVGREMGNVVLGEAAVEARDPEEVCCMRGLMVGELQVRVSSIGKQKS